MQWSDLTIVLAIGRSGSLSGAARTLKLNHSTVFRRINAIEEELGVRFFDRLPNGYILTEAGETAMCAAERIDEEMHSLSRDLVGKDLRLQGTIRVTAPEGVSLTLLGPLLAKFCKLHPHIHIDHIVTSNTLQLARREADVAIRVTARPPDNSIGRRICPFRFAVYATNSYLNSVSQTPLENQHWLMPEDAREWFKATTWKKLYQANARNIYSSNSTVAIANMCKNGLGLAPLPCFLGDAENKLVRVIEPKKDMSLDLWILIHPDLRHTTRVKALRDFLQESLQSKQHLFTGSGVD